MSTLPLLDLKVKLHAIESTYRSISRDVTDARDLAEKLMLLNNNGVLGQVFHVVGGGRSLDERLNESMRRFGRLIELSLLVDAFEKYTRHREAYSRLKGRVSFLTLRNKAAIDEAGSEHLVNMMRIIVERLALSSEEDDSFGWYY